MSVKMTELGPPKILPSVRATRKLAKMVRINIVELWGVTKCLQQSGECLFK